MNKTVRDDDLRVDELHTLVRAVERIENHLDRISEAIAILQRDQRLLGTTVTAHMLTLNKDSRV